MSPATASGRAGRLRLQRQLAAATRASDLLDRKRRIVADELDRLRLLADRTAAEWEAAALDAATWLQRCSALDGQRALDAARPAAVAVVEVTLGGAMGLHYPLDAQVSPVGPPARTGSSALVHTAGAHTRALQAAARHAAVSEAVRRLTRELAHVRARQRAIDHRWIPPLTAALRTLEAQLDEADREENVRLRWAARLTSEEGT